MILLDFTHIIENSYSRYLHSRLQNRRNLKLIRFESGTQVQIVTDRENKLYRVSLTVLCELFSIISLLHNHFLHETHGDADLFFFKYNLSQSLLRFASGCIECLPQRRSWLQYGRCGNCKKLLLSGFITLN
jgi:hypothetical protein